MKYIDTYSLYNLKGVLQWPKSLFDWPISLEVTYGSVEIVFETKINCFDFSEPKIICQNNL